MEQNLAYLDAKAGGLLWDLGRGLGLRASRAWDLCRIQDLGFRVQELGFRVQDLGFRNQGLGFRV